MAIRKFIPAGGAGRVRFDAWGDREFRDGFALLRSSVVTRRSRQAINVGARITARAVKDAAPTSDKSTVWSGLLKKSIAAKPARTTGFANRGFSEGARGFGPVVFRKVQSGRIETYSLVGARRKQFKVAVGINWNRTPGSKQQYGKYKNPTRYIHLAEGGARMHMTSRGLHPGARPHRFMAQATQRSMAAALAAISMSLRTSMETEISRLRNKTAAVAFKRAA